MIKYRKVFERERERELCVKTSFGNILRQYKKNV